MTAPVARPVRVRVSGHQADVEAVAAVLAGTMPAGAVDVVAVSAPRRNRRDPGVRVYLAALIVASHP